MPVLSLTDITISFSGPPVLENVNLHIDAGERVCLLGRNGAGKSTLLKIISGEYGPNSGAVTFPAGGKATSLPQTIPDNLSGSNHDIIATGFDSDGSQLIAHRQGDASITLDPERQWQMEQKIEKTAEQLAIALDTDFSKLSGGMKRRVLLAKALVCDPAILVLDEPTNHMDIDSILWLENFLLRSKISLVFVTHDRSFLRKLATRIIEVELGQANSFRCDYDTFLIRKEELLEAEAKNQAAFEKKLSQEEAWLRKGIKARRTRNEGRVKALKQMREEHASWRKRDGQSSFSLQNANISGRKVITATQASAVRSGKEILKPFDLQIMRGDRIGIIGPNGSGKTTLLKLLLDELPAAAGEVEHGTKLEIAYFDQLRDQLDETLSVFDNVADGNETVVFDGQKRHVMTYLQDFLFTLERARSSTKTLSGGERNRLLLAKLFTQPANLFVLDEPTNDLDAETLELLEELILDFQGTLLLVSHDREFLNNTVTSIIALDGEGRVEEHPGSYDDWIAKRSQQTVDPVPTEKKPSRNTWKQKTLKFTNRQQRELDELPQRIEDLDTKKEALSEKLANPKTYIDAPDSISGLQSELAAIEAELESVYARWEELESLKEELSQ
ncbi:MAG: ATP-binding cassette domain-containing protein [Verrucomicrobiota bacterium]